MYLSFSLGSTENPGLMIAKACRMPAPRRFTLPLTLTFACCLTGAVAFSSEPATIGKLPIHITSSGSYRLASDLSFAPSQGAAIRVDADDVTIDLAGHTLQGLAGSDSLATGILADNRRGLTVTGGVIRGFYFGIDLREPRDSTRRSADHRLTHLVLTQNHYFGIRVMGRNCEVRHCTITDTGGSTRPRHTIPHGIRMAGPQNAVRHCNIIDLRLRQFPDDRGEIVGVHFDAAKDAVFEHNRVIELSNQRDDPFDSADIKERTFAVWFNGGPQKDTFVTVTGNTFVGFTVPLAFAPGSDGRVSDNEFYGADVKPIRGRPAAQLSENTSLPGQPE